jgi:transcriptional regulator NrdR family protein
MNCPNCDAAFKGGVGKVIQSHGDTVESHIRQRRCKACNHKIWTIEVELPPASVKWYVCPETFVSVPKRKPGALRVQVS